MANSNVGFRDSEVARKLAARFRESMTPESMRSFWAALPAIDLTPTLPQVAVPTLVIYRNSEGPMEWAREVASTIPYARLVTTGSQRGDAILTDDETRVVEDFLGVTHEAAAPEAAHSSPSRVAHASRTILFTDIEGNTDLLQRLGDEGWRAVLRDHERITRGALKAHGGTEVKNMGDGFMASFDPHGGNHDNSRHVSEARRAPDGACCPHSRRPARTLTSRGAHISSTRRESGDPEGDRGFLVQMKCGIRCEARSA